MDKVDIDKDLYEKFQKRLESLHNGQQMTFQKHEDLLTKIIEAPLCRKCRKCYEENPSCAHNMPHHKNVVKHNQSVADDFVNDGKRRCRYVLFQKWFDFLVNNRNLLENSSDYKESLKRIMLSFHHQNIVSPNFEWHFWQLFQEHLKPKEVRSNSSSKQEDINNRKGNGFERFREFYKEEEKKILFEQRESNVSELSFLIFFVGFYVEEYGFLCDKKVVTDLNMETTLYELDFDEVGKVNLYASIHHRFLDEILARFDKGVISFEAFDQCFTVRDLYTLVTGKK